MDSNKTEVVFVDGIQALGVHNGVARLLMMRLSSDGKPIPALEVLIPATAIRSVMEGLGKVAK
jgi:hypothetical protein